MISYRVNKYQKEVDSVDSVQATKKKRRNPYQFVCTCTVSRSPRSFASFPTMLNRLDVNRKGRDHQISGDTAHALDAQPTLKAHLPPYGKSRGKAAGKQPEMRVALPRAVLADGCGGNLRRKHMSPSHRWMM